MKAITSLFAFLGLATMLLAQTATDPVLPYAVNDGVSSKTYPSNDAYTTQRGTMLITRNNGQSLELGYVLTPQPATRYLTLDLQADMPLRPTVYITTIEGSKTSVQADANHAATRTRLTVDLRALPEGMYYLIVDAPGVGETEGMPIIKLDAVSTAIQ